MTDLSLAIDTDSQSPPFHQIRDQITEQVGAGILPPGRRLPPVRSLATSLGLAPNTVAKAYRALEISGVVETRGRAGTFIAGRGVERSAREAAMTYVESVRALGLSDAEAVQHVQRALGS